MRRGVIALAGLLSGAACACAGPLEVTHVLTGPAMDPKPEDAPVSVYINQSPGRPYREVAQIRVRATGPSANARDVIAAAAEDAREIGADAILVDARRHYGSVQVWIGCDGRPRVDPERRLNARVTAIQFVPEGAAQPEPAPSGPPPVQQKCE